MFQDETQAPETPDQAVASSTGGETQAETATEENAA